MSFLMAKGITFSYDGEKPILQDVSLTLQPGQATVLAGASGAGKSTLCRILCGLIPNVYKGQLSGTVSVGDFEVTTAPLYQSAQRIAMVFQNPDHQLICQTVEDELAFGPENLCLEPKIIRQKVDETLARFHLEHLALRDPASLSGGQKKLVAIASALILGPRVLVLDEPMASLDESSRILVRSAIQELLAQGHGIISVEHDLTLADYATNILYLREGRLYDNP